MNNRKYKIFSYASLAVTGIYFVLNVWLVLNLTLGILPYSDLLEIVIPLDGYTWHVFGIFAISTLIIKCINAMKKEKSIKSLLNLDIILHLIFSFVTLFLMFFIFNIAF